MKNTILSAVLLSFAIIASSARFHAQNIQVHYDFGRSIYDTEERGRQRATITLEHFNADKWGSWYYFVDIDLGRHFTESAYTEISREFKFGTNSPLAAHIEYDGGLNRNGSFQQAALGGLAFNGHSADFSKTFSVQVLYKQYFKSYENTHAYSSAQLTGVWGLTFAGGKVTFSGFIDFWRGEKANNHGCLVVLSEPQLWYNVTKNLSLGGEVEMSYNFIYNQDPNSTKKFFVNPTLAVKWNF